MSLCTGAGNCTGVTGHCQHGGTCSSDPSRVCDCKAGFAGTYCELGAPGPGPRSHSSRGLCPLTQPHPNNPMPEPGLVMMYSTYYISCTCNSRRRERVRREQRDAVRLGYLHEPHRRLRVLLSQRVPRGRQQPLVSRYLHRFFLLPQIQFNSVFMDQSTCSF